MCVTFVCLFICLFVHNPNPDTFVHGDEEDLVGRVLRGEVSTAPKPSSARQIFENNELQIRQGNYTR